MLFRSPLLFIIVLEALSREMRSGCPKELLYADDLAIDDLRVNLGKTKIMVSSCDVGKIREQGKYPCGVCRKGVGVNSVYCQSCNHWVHYRCSKVRGRLQPNQDFKCK